MSNPSNTPPEEIPLPIEVIRDRLQGVSLYFVGMMGAGKTTIGRIVARRLGYRFFDTDHVIEKAAGCSVSAIFAESGEAAFRELETQVLGQLAAYRRTAIATGGGTIIKPMNWSYLRHGVVVWLDIPIDQLYTRLRGNTTRPLLQDPNPQQKLQELFDQRRSLYAQADVHILLTVDESPERAATKVLQAINAVIKSKTPPPTNQNP